MNRQSWTIEVIINLDQEDEAIIRLVDEFGFQDWTKIADKLK